MVAIHSAVTLPINPPGTTPTLSQSQIWTALTRKIHHGEEFVPVIDKTTVTETHTDAATGETTITRDVQMKEGKGPPHLWTDEQKAKGRGGLMTEKIVLPAAASEAEGFTDGGCSVDFYPEDGSHVQNIVGVDLDGALWLTFAFKWVHPEVDVSSAEGRREMEAIRKGYMPMARGAVEMTIKSAREMVRDGRIEARWGGCYIGRRGFVAF